MEPAEADVPPRAGPSSKRLRRVAAFAAAETVGRGAKWLTVFVLPWILGPVEYGIVVLLGTFEGVATGLLMLGQDRAIMWRGAVREEMDGSQPWVATAVVITTLACVASLAAVAAVSALRGGLLLGVPVWPHLWLLAVAVICLNVNRIVLAFVRVAGRARDFGNYRIATGVGRLVATLGLAGAAGSSLAYPVGAVIGTVAGGARLWRRILAGTFGRAAIRRANLGSMVKYGAPLSLHAVAMNSIAFVDRWIIGSTLGLAVVGSYGWYYMLGSAVVFLFAALSIYYEPAIYRECRQSGSLKALKEYLGISLVAAGIYSLLGVVAAALGSGLVPDAIRGDPTITRIVLVAHWFYPVYLSGNYLLSAFGRTGRVAGMSSAALGVVVVANLILVPRLGAVGGAWATLIGTLALVAATGLMLRRLRIGARVLIGPTLGVAAIAAGGILLPGLLGLAIAGVCLTLYGLLHMRGTGREVQAT